MEETLRLAELNQFILQTIELNFGSDLWISCEFSNLKYSRGHYYVDLIDKDGYSEKIIAKSQAVIWKTNVQYIEQTKNVQLDHLAGTGLAVRIRVQVDFHPLYGLKLNILDLDPNYTLGDLEIKRKRTLERLKSEQLLTKNGEILLPSVLNNIAIISASNAAGYKDFIEELSNNSYGYSFKFTLFEAALQGDRLVPEFLQALSKIGRKGSFDAVVIIRGGGSKIDLSGYDEYDLAKKIAECRLPVLTGIGHEIDVSIADMVSHQSFKTPTAVAGFLIERSLFYESEMIQMMQKIKTTSHQIFQYKKTLLDQSYQKICSSTKIRLETSKVQVKATIDQILYAAQQSIRSKEKTMEHLYHSIQLSSPEEILKKGYAWIQQDNRRIRNIQNIKKQSPLHILMEDGKILVKTVQNGQEK